MLGEVACEVDGPVAQEDMLKQHWPVFVMLQSTVPLLLWLVAVWSEGWRWYATAGLDSMFAQSSLTGLKLHDDCTDLRWQLWRWWTYQFTHCGLLHVGCNVIVTFVLGAPLEGFEGSLRTFAIFNLGVVGAGCLHAVSDPHRNLVGMSGGCFSIIGMHCTELCINWFQTKFRLLKLGILVIIVLAFVLEVEVKNIMGVTDNTDHSAHVGGFLAGVLSGSSLGRNIREEARCSSRDAGSERCLCLSRAAVNVTGLACIVLCIFWVAQWPPRSCWDRTSWCWARQLRNITHFGDERWHCARCDDGPCADKWTNWSKLGVGTWVGCGIARTWDVTER